MRGLERRRRVWGRDLVVVLGIVAVVFVHERRGSGFRLYIPRELIIY